MKHFYFQIVSILLLRIFFQNVSLSQTIVDLPATNGQVYAIAVSGNTIYIGGFFTSVGGTLRNGIAALDATTLAVTSWNPDAGEGSVYTIAISGTDIYVGGMFTTIGGQTRNNIAKLTSASNAADATWNPNATGGSYVNTIVIDGTTVYAGGLFTTIGGQTRTNLAALSSTSTGAATSWVLNTDDVVRTLVYNGGAIFVGGDFHTIGGSSRGHLANFIAGGALQGWNPNPDNSVYSIAFSGPTTYVGGTFYNIGVTPAVRNNLAAIRPDGEVTTWNSISAGGSVGIYAIAFSGSAVYVGGKFGKVGAIFRNQLAAINTSGTVTDWNPDIGIDASLDAGVHSLALDLTKGRVYAGGQFTTVLGGSRPDFVGLTNTADPSLPVELSSFTANVVQNNAVVSWSTATETNNYGFEVERRMDNRKWNIDNWAKIAFVEGHGTTNVPQSYSYSDRPGEGKYQYRLKQIDRDGRFEYSNSVEVTIAAPIVFALEQNYPNPFNPATNITFTVPANGHATLKVFNTIGQEVATLFHGEAQAGIYNRVQFNASGFTSGLYFSRLEHDGKVQLKRMTLLK